MPGMHWCVFWPCSESPHFPFHLEKIILWKDCGAIVGRTSVNKAILTKNLITSPPPLLPYCLAHHVEWNGRKLSQYLIWSTSLSALTGVFSEAFQCWPQNAVVFPSFSRVVPCRWRLPLYVLAPCLFLCLVPLAKPFPLPSLQECNCHLLGVWQSPGFFLVILLKPLIYPPLLSYVPV